MTYSRRLGVQTCLQAGSVSENEPGRAPERVAHRRMKLTKPAYWSFEAYPRCSADQKRGRERRAVARGVARMVAEGPFNKG